MQLKPAEMENLQALERMLRDASCGDAIKLRKAEDFVKKHPEPRQVEGLELSTIRAIVSSISKARDARLLSRSNASYDIKTWQIAITYCQEGIMRAEKLQPQAIVGTLYSDAGNCSLNLAMRLGNEGLKHTLLQHSIDYYAKAIHIADGTNKNAAAYLLSYVADACKELAEINHGTKKIEWMEKAVDALLEGADRTAPFNPTHASRQYSIASSYEYRLATLAQKTPQRQTEFLKSAIENAREAMRLYTTDLLYTARVNYDIGKYADFLFTITQCQQDAKLAVEHYKIAVEQFRQFPSKKADLSIIASQRVAALTSLA